MRHRLLLLLALTLPVAGSVLAQGAPPAPAPAPAPDIELSADLRAEYLAGEAMLVRFTVRNTGAEARSFADLANRPWLVRFEIKDSAGKTQTWYTTPPEQDGGARWSISPRGQKRALLEIPSSGRLPKGDYTLTIRVLDEGGERALPPHSFRLAPPAPAGGEISLEHVGTERTGHQAAWLHKAARGFDLYLHHVDGADPRRELADYFLLHLDAAAQPILTRSRPQERWNRYIYWQSGPASVYAVRLQGQGQGLASEKPERVDLPYPKVELIGQGSTDATGTLHAPFWVPAPSGRGGELRVASISERGVPRFRQVARLSEKPAWLETTVDTNGDLRLLLPADGNVDLYTLASAGELPAAGKRLYRAVPEEALSPRAARFGYAGGEERSGLGALLLLSGAAGTQARWLSPDGAASGSYATLNLPNDATVLDLLPLDAQRYGVLYRDAKGGWVYNEPGGEPAALPAAPEGALFTNAKGEVLLRTFAEGGPIAVRPVR